MTRYVVRPPNIRTTPRALAEALNARSTLNGGSNRIQPDWGTDFFLFYPSHNWVLGSDERYLDVFRFSRGSKADQRTKLAESGIPVPATPTSSSVGTFIVRPLRHRAGIGWRTTTDPQDFDQATEYIQELFPKTHEYRIICVLGEPLITLFKRVPEGLAVDQPWNHAQGSSFVTVTDPSNNRLRHADVYERLKNNSVIQAAHLVGVDVMYDSRTRTYAVAEFNFCPALTIDNNLQKVAEYVAQANR